MSDKKSEPMDKLQRFALIIIIFAIFDFVFKGAYFTYINRDPVIDIICLGLAALITWLSLKYKVIRI